MTWRTSSVKNRVVAPGADSGVGALYGQALYPSAVKGSSPAKDKLPRKQLSIRTCQVILGFIILLVGLLMPLLSHALLTEPELAARVVPPYQLGEKIQDTNVWTLVNLDGSDAGYFFESEPLTPIPGFSGQPINLLIAMSKEGRLLNVEIVSHNEPIFVSGLGEAPFHDFISQYRGLSIYEPMSVGVPYGRVEGASAQRYLDGVTKATASVRIAHETILAAANAVAKDKMQGIGNLKMPILDSSETFTFEELVAQNIARRHVITNREVQALFANTEWENDDAEALKHPHAAYLDLWIIDIGPIAVARSVLDADGLATLAYFLSISPHDEPVLLIDQGRHGLVSDAFVRNTEPDLMSASQDGLPVKLRDADLELSLKPGMPSGHQLVVRADRRLGFDPTLPWDLTLKVIREHGSFMPTIGSRDLSFEHVNPERFYRVPTVEKPLSAREAALMGRLPDLVIVGLLLLGLLLLLYKRQQWLADRQRYWGLRWTFLGAMIVFIGWYGQGQLSIVTPLGTLNALAKNQSLEFLLFDPFSLLIWLAVVVSLFLWGRGFFCGWLCPYGAMQEFTGKIGQRLGLPQWKFTATVDARLITFKYLVLLLLVVLSFTAPSLLDYAVEVEPFKTAITTYFTREWYYVIYAVFWLLLSMVLFRGFCRYICPLGALLAIADFCRLRKWIPRRDECGTRCQLCAVRCQYEAINRSGTVNYRECFQCLECVKVYADNRVCVPLVIKNRGGKSLLTDSAS